MRVIRSEHAPKPSGAYVQAVDSFGFVFCSGQLAVSADTGEFLGGDAREQTRQAIANISATLSATGLDLVHVVRTSVYLTDMRNLDDMVRPAAIPRPVANRSVWS